MGRPVREFLRQHRTIELSPKQKTSKGHLEAAIAHQVKNLRDADDSLKRFMQEDVRALTDDLSETEMLLQKLEDRKRSQMYAIRDIEEIKERLLSWYCQALCAKLFAGSG